MEKKPSPLPPASKFKFLYFLPMSVMSPEGPSPTRIHSPRPRKRRPSSAALFSRNASARVKIGRSFRFREPRSPRISCIGNVMSKGGGDKKERKRRNDRRGKEHRNAFAAPRTNQQLILKLLEVFKKKETKAANREAEPAHLPPGGKHKKSAPKVGHAKKIFNWRVRGDSSSAVVPHPPSAISKGRQGKRKEVAVVENIVLEPRKEINLWKKRMVAPPPPLVV